MGRTLDPVCKLCRREGMKLYLKGARCDSPKCPVERRQGVLPGMHGYRRPKLSEYGVRLREKQRLKRFYGVWERQFRRYFDIASLLVRPGDVVAVKVQPRALQLVKLALQEKPTPIPEYMEMVTPEPPAA